MSNDLYRTSFNFKETTRPKITKLQGFLQEKDLKPITKGEAVEKAIDFYLETLERKKT